MCNIHIHVQYNIDTKSDQEVEQMINKSTERRESLIKNGENVSKSCQMCGVNETLSPGTNRLQDMLVLLVGCKPSAPKCRLQIPTKKADMFGIHKFLEKNCVQNPNEFQVGTHFWQIFVNKISQQCNRSYLSVI